MLSVTYAECNMSAMYAGCRTECLYRDCRYAECRGAILSHCQWRETKFYIICHQEAASEAPRSLADEILDELYGGDQVPERYKNFFVFFIDAPVQNDPVCLLLINFFGIVWYL